MRGLKRIAMSGRAVCATIHQPSIAIFNEFDALLLLKRGGETVFYGELGKDSENLIDYFEQYSATTPIQPGENPATWMLTTIGAGSASTDTKPFDYAGSYQVSDLHKECLQEIERRTKVVSEAGRIGFPARYATGLSTQISVVLGRAKTVYWRSPSYNTVRMVTAAVLALLIGSVYASSRTPVDESDMNSRASTIFVSFLFMAVNSLNTVLALFEIERNMYYRHKAALMYDKRAMLVAFTISELPFIVFSSMLFVSIFYFMIGFTAEAGRFFLFYFFFGMAMGIFTFLGQMFVALTPNSITAQGFGALTVSLSALFTGVLIRPDDIPRFWNFMYWVMPGHYIFEGLLVSQFDGDQTPIIASPGSPFWEFLGCDDKVGPGTLETECVGTADQWVFASFGGNFIPEHIPTNMAYLVILFVATRAITGFSLGALNYRRT
jgi:ABC-type multidrug transport system permease subunit